MVSQLDILTELCYVEFLDWCDICDFFLLGGAHKGAKFFLLGPLGVRVVADVPLFWLGWKILLKNQQI